VGGSGILALVPADLVGIVMTLDLTPLHKAIVRLEEGLLRYQLDVSDTQIRDGLMLRFKFG
jgi:hypothetical protein